MARDKNEETILAGWAEEFDKNLAHKAALTICHNATDIDDARILLSMLDLVDDQVRWPSIIPGTVRFGAAPSAPPGAPLPSSGYGAVSS